TLHVTADERAAIGAFEHNTGAPDVLRLAVHVGFDDEARQQTLRQNRVVTIDETETLIRGKLRLEVRFLLRQQLRDQILLASIVKRMTEAKLAHQGEQKRMDRRWVTRLRQDVGKR